MSGLVMLLGIVALAAILTWSIGSFVLRLVGVLAVIDGIGGVVVHHGLISHWHGLEIAVGFAMWMAGHWLFAAKYKAWRSVAGRAPWKLPVLAALAPVPVR